MSITTVLAPRAICGFRNCTLALVETSTRDQSRPPALLSAPNRFGTVCRSNNGSASHYDLNPKPKQFLPLLQLLPRPLAKVLSQTWVRRENIEQPLLFLQRRNKMPSLFNVSESDPIQAAKPKECGNDIIVLDADADMEVAMEDESQTDNKGPQLSNPALNKQSGDAGMSIDDPIEVSDEKDSQDLATSESSTPNSKKRRVTPNDDSGSKQKQQKKVNQMTLSSFFFKGNKATTSVSTPSKTPQRTASSAPKTPTPSSTGKQLTEKKLEDAFVPIEVDKDANQSQPAATPSKAMQSTPKPATKTENNTETSVETESKHGSAVCEVEIAAEVPETKPTNEPSTANLINVLSESVVKKKPRAKTTKSKKTSPKKTSPKKTGPSGKESTARKPKKTKALDSLVTNVEKKELSESDLADENRSLLQKYRTMKERYLERVHDVTKKHRDGLPEEDLGNITLQPITDDTELKTNEDGSCEDFPSQVVANMALLIEGR